MISINDIEILSTIKCGGQATVYSAKLLDSNVSMPVAVKLYNQSPHAYACYIKELNVLSRAEHLSIPRLWACFDHNGQFGLVLELLHGTTFIEKIRPLKPIEPSLLRHIACRLLVVLSYLHEKLAVVHGDLSPDNVFLCHDGTVVLLDYGAFLEGAFGKRKYLSRERLEGDPATIWSDLYSWGAMLFEALVLRPFDDRNYKREFNDLRRSLGAEDEDLFVAIRACLAPSPHLRPENAQVLWQLLKAT